MEKIKKNSKTTVYILLPAVIFIWGLIFYRIFGGVDTASVKQLSRREAIPTRQKEILGEATFQLDLTYADPFLGGKAKRKEDKTESTITAETSPTPEPALPLVEYRGCIANQRGITAYLVVNGQVNLCGKGQELEGLQIIEIREDSLWVDFGKEKKWIKKL